MANCSHINLGISCMESTYQEYDRETQDWGEIEFTGHLDVDTQSAKCLDCGEDVTELLEEMNIKW